MKCPASCVVYSIPIHQYRLTYGPVVVVIVVIGGGLRTHEKNNNSVSYKTIINLLPRTLKRRKQKPKQHETWERELMGRSSTLGSSWPSIMSCFAVQTDTWGGTGVRNCCLP